MRNSAATATRLLCFFAVRVYHTYVITVSFLSKEKKKIVLSAVIMNEGDCAASVNIKSVSSEKSYVFVPIFKKLRELLRPCKHKFYRFYITYE